MSRSDAELKTPQLSSRWTSNGKAALAFSTVFNDVWDYDLGIPRPSLIDFEVNGQKNALALIFASKQGDYLFLDRRTGKALTGGRDRPVPQGGRPEESRFGRKTQLFLDLPHIGQNLLLKEREYVGYDV